MEKEKVAQLFSDKEFLKELFKRKSENEINELFTRRDIKLTLEELEEICDIVEACTSGLMVLSDSSLDDIVGGVRQTDMANIFKDNYIIINQVIEDIKNGNSVN